MFSRPTDPAVSIDDGHLVVDGEVLEDVLAEVYRRCGPDARILRADRTIVGGVAGFFGREIFHVVAQPASDEDRGATAADATSTGGSVDHGPLDGPSFAAALAEALNSTPEVPEEAAGLLDDRIDEISDTAPSRVAAAVTGAALPPAVPAVPVMPVMPVMPVHWTEPATAVRDTPPLPPLPPLGPPPVATTISEPAMAPEPEMVPTADIPWQPLPGDGRTFPDEHLLAGPTIVLESPAPTGEIGTAAARWYDRATGDRTRALTQLPLPELLAKIDRLLPLNASRPPSGVVAVVGDAEDAVDTARRLALWSPRPEQSSVVLLAPDLRSRDTSRVVVTSLALAADQRNRWARRPGTTFVAVALEPGDAGSAWVRRALEVLDPAQVRYAAPAWRSVSEVLDRVRMIGGVDCLDLVQLDQSAEPAEFLSTEPPVATVDGRPATPELWAAHLLAAQQHDDQRSPRHEFGGTA